MSTSSNYIDKIKGLEENWKRSKGDRCLEDFRGRSDRASRIEQTLFDLRVTISRLLEKRQKPEPKAAEIPVLSGINLPRIQIPTFDDNILNWRLFWEQFQAAVHDKPHLGEIDKLTYLRDALKDGPARNVIQGLTQSAESYQEAIRCLQDRYNRPGSPTASTFVVSCRLRP